jgi:hypothetical protein
MNATDLPDPDEYTLGDHVAPKRPIRKRAERATRRAEALKMRLAGIRIDHIAKHFSVHPRTVYAWVAEAIRDIPREEADELRSLERDRLDALQQAVWADAMRGDTKAVDRVLAIMDRRARYLGLYDAQAEGLERVGSLLDRLILGEG